MGTVIPWPKAIVEAGGGATTNLFGEPDANTSTLRAGRGISVSDELVLAHLYALSCSLVDEELRDRVHQPIRQLMQQRGIA